ncbi:phenylacetaldehyde reductase-like isoform X2 [Apium graveolens]|uniref:phenylacetaldehyde reductase-like isoform X2 n=1 Tax=Apium graveolens TaxID=4045 RepID=UPI003D7BFBEA
MSGRGKVVCVTGASGFIASWLVKMLLERDYTVNATVRSLNDRLKTEHLLALDGAKERLHLFEANLLDEGSFDPAVIGCTCVFHTASPVDPKSSNPQEELIEPAVKGTLNVLQSCAKVPSIKRVVITSSLASVMVTEKPLKPDVVMDETWFSSAALCEEQKLYYHLSKTLAEQAALKFTEEHKIDLVTLHPGFVLGPLLQPLLNITSEVMLNFIKKGQEIFPDGIYRFVDVRDVAYAHLQAFENPSACGRYCLVGKVTYSSEAFEILHNLYPAISIPERCNKEKRVGPPYHVSKERAKSLGIDFLPLEVSLKDTVESFKEKNFFIF